MTKRFWPPANSDGSSVGRSARRQAGKLKHPLRAPAHEARINWAPSLLLQIYLWKLIELAPTRALDTRTQQTGGRAAGKACLHGGGRVLLAIREVDSRAARSRPPLY